MENLEESLRRWFKEKWTAQDGSECGNYKGRGRVKCRPSRKVSKKTPKTWSELGKKGKARAVRNKQLAHRRGHQFSSHRSTKTWSADKGKYQPSTVKDHVENSMSKFILEKWNPKNKEKHAACKASVKSRFKVWPSAYASAAVVRCYKKKVSSKD